MLPSSSSISLTKNSIRNTSRKRKSKTINHHRPPPQETPDAPEALKCIPGLALADIPKKAASIPTALAAEQGASILRQGGHYSLVIMSFLFLFEIT